MKNIDLTKNKLNTIFKRYGLILSLLFISLVYSGSAWATTYYLLWGTNDNPANWSNNMEEVADNNFTWDIGEIAASTTIFFGVSTTTSSTNMISANGATRNCGICNWFQGQENGGKYFSKFNLSSTQSVRIVYNHDSPGTYTISAAGLAVATSITGGIISPTSATVSSGGNQSFTVTPNSGYVVTSVSYSGTATNNWTSGNTISLTNITSAGTLTVTCGPSVPVVRMGDIPTPNPATNEAVTAYAYLAKTGCANVTKLRIYIGKGESPTKLSDYVEYTTGNPYSINTQYAITIPAATLNEIADGASSFTAHIKATGFNSAGESELSDELTFAYEACPIGVSLSPISGEMIPNQATTFTGSVTGTSNPIYKWYVNNVEQVGETASTFNYTPTVGGNHAIKLVVKDGADGCSSTKTANMTTCNIPTVSLSGAATTTPWDPVVLTATVSNTNNVQFTVTGATIVATKIGDTEWQGKFKSGNVGTYVVTATATSISGNCGTASDTESVEVEADVEVCP